MSTTYSIVCDDCKVVLWVGQGDHLYENDAFINFLHEHLGHSLRFLCDLADDEESLYYEEVQWDTTQQ